MVHGPMIDPPYPQHEFRPWGVYMYPDARVGMQDRTIVEVWGANRECLRCGSILTRLVTPETIQEFWDWCDAGRVVPIAVGDTTYRPCHDYLKLTP